MISISAMFDGENHEFEGHISEEIRDHGAIVSGFSFAEGESLDPYETASAVAILQDAAHLAKPGPFRIRVEAEHAWIRVIIPLKYLAKAVGGSADGYQTGYFTRREEPATFLWQFHPGKTGLQLGDRL